jgi:hypothetical protein
MLLHFRESSIVELGVAVVGFGEEVEFLISISEVERRATVNAPVVLYIGIGLQTLIAEQLGEHNVIAVHWDQNLNRAIRVASHGLVDLRKIPRQLVQLCNLCCGQFLGRAHLKVSRIGIIRMKSGPMQL